MVSVSLKKAGRIKDSKNLGLMLRDVGRLYVRRFEQHAESLGLTLPQCTALMRLANNEGVSQVRLAELTDLEPMTLLRILDRMESEGWLERRSDPRDRRIRCLFLTPRAKPLLDDIFRLIELTRREAVAGIPKRQGDLLLKSLDMIRSNFIALGPLPAAGTLPPPPVGRRATGNRDAGRGSVES
jgi:MarR family transcriptional regulator, transcriptional regulator for hemolysin